MNENKHEKDFDETKQNNENIEEKLEISETPTEEAIIEEVEPFPFVPAI